ncbi:hypothetical protein WJX77_010192 [Trebouxia sp. C0004]
MVFHCWLEERQLVREAKYLLQALEILAVSIEKHSAKHQQSVPGKLRSTSQQPSLRLAKDPLGAAQKQASEQGSREAACVT